MTLQAWDGYVPLSIDGCRNAINNTIGYPNVELTGPMTFDADGTGALPLRLTETYNTYSCTREGVLNLTYTPNQTGGDVYFSGQLDKVGSGLCAPGSTTYWEGRFAAPTDDYDQPIEWVVTP